MNKLLKTIDKFFNPKKYFDDRITKPIRRLKAGDIIYVLYIPEYSKTYFENLTFYNFDTILKGISIEKGELLNLSLFLDRKRIGVKYKVISSTEISDFIITIERNMIVDDFRKCSKNIFRNEDYFGGHYIATNKKSIADVINSLMMVVETNFKRWKKICQDESSTEMLTRKIKMFKKEISYMKYKLKLL